MNSRIHKRLATSISTLAAAAIIAPSTYAIGVGGAPQLDRPGTPLVSGPARRHFGISSTASQQGSFDWADAGTGAGVTLAVLVLLAMAGLARRSRTALTS